MNGNQGCSLETIKALVPVYHRWDVKPDGSTNNFYDHGDLDHDMLDIEEYVCDNCGDFFTPDKRYSFAAISKAWEDAMSHIAA